MTTVAVWSDFAIALEVGLVRGDRDFKNTLVPGPNHRRVSLSRGLNEAVDETVVREWMRVNKHLKCVKDKRIRIVKAEEVTA